MLLLVLISITILNVLCESKYVEQVVKGVKSEIFEGATQNFTFDKNLRKYVSYNQDETFQPNEYCRGFKTCAECTQIPVYNCEWCHNYGCTDVAYKLCPRAAKRTKSFQDLCPKIESSNRILIAYGLKANIKIKLRAPDPILYDKEVICQVQLGNRLTLLKALIISGFIYCYPIIFDDKYEEATSNGTLQIIWGGMDPFSNIIPITAYRCESMATECESCIEIPHGYGCGWCSETKSCVIGDKCSEDIIRWTVNRLLCQERKLQYV